VERVWEGMKGVVEGLVGRVGELDDGDGVDWGRVDKIYKLGEMDQLKIPNVREKKIAAIETAVAIKSVT